MSKFILTFRLNKLSREKIEEKAESLGMDFDTYFDKILFCAMKKMEANNTFTNEPFFIESQQIKKPVLKNRHRLVQSLSSKYNTKISSVIETLLLNGDLDIPDNIIK